MGAVAFLWVIFNLHWHKLTAARQEPFTASGSRRQGPAT